MKLDLTDFALPRFNKPREGAVMLSEYPDVLAELHPDIIGLLDISKVSSASNHKLPWKCAQGHEWLAVVQKRTQKGTQCPECPDRRVVAGKNDLASQCPEVAGEWHPTKNGSLRPSDVASGSHEYVWWACIGHGHEWTAQVYNRTIGKTNCPTCSGNQVSEGFNDLSTTHPELHSQLLDTEVITSKGSHALREWVCEVGHTYTSAVYNRKRGQGCGVCSGDQVIEGLNDLYTTHREMVNETWNYDKNKISPTELTYGAHAEVHWKCKEVGHEWQANLYSRTGGNKSGCPVCAGRMSKGEAALTEFIREVAGELEVIENYREVKSLATGRSIEFDVYLPELKIGIEYNGLIYHSEYYNKGRTYHLNKRLSAEAAGVRLITVWEDDWKFRPEVTKRALKAKIGVLRETRVYARKLAVREITGPEASEFLEANHIQGKAAGSHYIGAFVGEELVAVMVLKQRSSEAYELVRYATSCQVVGGHSKMIKWVQRNTTIQELVTFADLDISDGTLYEKTGWSLDKELPPDYKYLVSGRYRKHKFGYRLERFRSDPSLKYQEGLTEKQLAELNNLYRIWDTGKKRYTLKLRKQVNE